MPVLRNSNLVRLMKLDGPVVARNTPWGSMGPSIFNYASAPIVLSDYRDAYRTPDWIEGAARLQSSPSLAEQFEIPAA
ncbi:alpha/beta-hydrolase family protein [Mesorhizobium sp. YC-2]|nr:alpha/beta-hydrolase family protein [Mesorhizobium sp. YC-2]